MEREEKMPTESWVDVGTSEALSQRPVQQKLSDAFRKPGHAAEKDVGDGYAMLAETTDIFLRLHVNHLRVHRAVLHRQRIAEADGFIGISS